MKLKFWPFPLLRNHPTTGLLNDVCDVLLEADWWKIEKHTEFDLVIACPAGRVSFWNANKYYAWGAGGRADLGSSSFAWKDEMPSRWHVRQMAKRLSRELLMDMRTTKEAQ